MKLGGRVKYLDSKTKEVVNDKIFDTVADSKLTQKAQDFVLYYLDSYNVKQSYMKAYGSDKKTAEKNGYTLLHKEDVQSEIKRLKKIMQIGYDIDPSRYVETLLKISNADIGDYIKCAEEEVPVYNDEGLPMINPDTGEQIVKKINKMHLIDSDTVDTSIITSIKQGKDGITIQLADKLKAMRELREFMGWQIDKKEEKESSTKELISTLNNSAKDSWDDDVDADLHDMKDSEKV